MPEYSNSKLYKIWSPSHPGDIYVGSTTQSLAKRMVGHRNKFTGYQNGKYPYTTSFKILEYGDARIELIEKFPCECKEELIAREGYYIRTLDCVNKITPGRTWKEWYQDNKEKTLNYQKQYYEDNKDRLAQQRKQYRVDNKEKIAQQQKKYRENNKEKTLNYKKKYYEDNKEKIAQQQKKYRENNKDKAKKYYEDNGKKYYEDNKEKIAQQQKKYREKNEERIRARNSKKITCECGSIIRYDCLSRHKRSKKHMKYLESIKS